MLVDTRIAIELPKGTYARLAARSGKASKQGIAVGGRVCYGDSDILRTSEYTKPVRWYFGEYV